MVDENNAKEASDHGVMIRQLIEIQMGMTHDGSMLFDYVKHLNLWASQACSQLWSLQQEISALRVQLAAQQSDGAATGGTASGEGKKA